MNRDGVLIVIPARLESSRLPRKMLLDASGKPLIYHTWSHAVKAHRANRVVIATDSVELATVARSFGAEVVMTSAECHTGTERLVELMENGWDKFDMYVNLQGDEPELSPASIDRCILRLQDNNCDMATLASEFLDGEDHLPNRVKVQLSEDGRYAKGFYRTKPPYLCYRHVGIYAYKPDILHEWRSFPHARAEQHSLEQFRPFDAGKIIGTDIVGDAPHGIDTEDDYRSWFLRVVSKTPMNQEI